MPGFRNLATVLLCAAPASVAQAAEVLHDHDANPFSNVFGLPDSTEGALLLDRGRSSFGLAALTASHAISLADGREQFVTDGETSRLEFRYRRGFGERYEVGVAVPWVAHQAGGLDSFIDSWHEWFGLPQGARDELPRDVLAFLYLRDGEPVVDFRDNVHGIGDLRLFGGMTLTETGRYASALRLSVKLPTGDADDLLGSGAVDVTAGLAGDWKALGRDGAWTAFYRLNAIFPGKPEYLADRYNEFVAQAAAGVSWQAWRRVALTIQGNVRGPLYDSDIEPLGETAVQLVLGGDISLTDRLSLLLAVGEDVKVNSVPDVTFQLALRYRPDQGRD